MAKRTATSRNIAAINRNVTRIADIFGTDSHQTVKTVALVDNGGDYVLIVDKTTGEILQEYKYSSRTEWGELQYNEKRANK